ncbi:MAG: phenylalanine--tRNA ligase subunit beta [Flavobacteriales bacterium]|nr:phenylalanine--tRNA ligase subunit beta [Flavobacteriales bacterium]
MKISYNWLKEYINTSRSPQEVGEILTSTGLEVEAIEEIQSVPGGLQGIVVGEVIEKGKHPDADRLSVTRVNIGEENPLHIVCGAPNVAAGQKVLVATVGATLHPLNGDPFTIKKGKIRGQVSEGMICAEDELGLGSSHAGIMVLPESATVGSAAADFLGLQSDYCLEIGLTPNRTDAMCHYGVARDLAAALHNMEGIDNETVNLTLPDVSGFRASADCPVKVNIVDSDKCPRYCGLVLRNITVADSPDWLKDRLKAIGLSPINNIVDITNFVMHECGQPLHAFDLNQIRGGQVVVTTLPNETRFTTLDDTERSLSSDDLMICNAEALQGNANEAGMCIAGVFGGIQSGVSNTTTSIFLESAYFNPVSIRKTARFHGLHTDASFRFERGVDPSDTLFAMKRAALLMQEIAGAEIDGGVYDSNPTPFDGCQITISPARVNELIGQSISEQVMEKILTSLDFNILNRDSGKWTIEAPLYRVDVTREADVVEEILRIYGYDNIAMPQKLNASLSFSKGVDRDAMQYKVSDYLAYNGWHEIMSNSLSRSEYATWIEDGEITSARTVRMLNPLSSDLDAMRQSLVFQGLEAIVLNQNHRNADLKLFEFGKTYFRTEAGFDEKGMLALWATGNVHEQNWDKQETPSSIFSVLKAIDGAFAKFNLDAPRDEMMEGDSIFAQKLIRKIRNKEVMIAGQIHPSLLKKFDIKSPVYYAEVKWDSLLEMLSTKHPSFHSLPKFPEMRRDLSLLVDTGITFQQIEGISRKQDKKILQSVGLFDVYEGKNLPAGKKSYAVSFTFRDEEQTLRDKQVDKIMSKIQESLNRELGAELR